MAVCNVNAVVCPGKIDCGGKAVLTLCLETEGRYEEPMDLVLVLDRSSSMCGAPLKAMQAGTARLLKLWESRKKVRVGVVSFGEKASLDCPLTGDRTVPEAAIQNLCCGGFTNVEAGLRAAKKMLESSCAGRQSILLFTDGLANVGNADGVAEAIRRLGITLYCIGPQKDRRYLEKWSGGCGHETVIGDVGQLEEAFQRAAEAIFCPGPALGEVLLHLEPAFRIDSIEDPVWGCAEQTGVGTLCWSLKKTSVPLGETLCLRVYIQHVGSQSGCLPVIHSGIYGDCTGAVLRFPDPGIEVCCGIPEVMADPCPEPVCVRLEGCQESMAVCAPVALSGLGRIIHVSTVVKHVCPGKRVAVAVTLTELDDCGREHPRGMKTLLIPAQEGEECRDVVLRCIQFIVPEALDAVGCSRSLCGSRMFRVRASANYIDTDYLCCEAQPVELG